MYENGTFSYIISPKTSIKGKIIINNIFKNLTLGTYIPLRQIPYGSSVYNVELKLGFGVNWPVPLEHL